MKISVEFNEDENCYIACLDGMPHVTATGETPEEAVEQLETLLEDVISLLEPRLELHDFAEEDEFLPTTIKPKSWLN